MKRTGIMIATVAFGAAVVIGSPTAGLAHGGGGGGHYGGGGGHFGGGGGGGGHFGGMPPIMHGGSFGGFHMNYGNDGYSNHYFYHGGSYRPYFPYFPSYDDDDPGYQYDSSDCARMRPYTGTYIGRDGRLHYCS